MTESTWSYTLVVWFFTFIKKVFFRDVLVRGAHKIPQKGPVIFVAAPHCNQFVDPIILISSSPRPIGFLMAAVSLKRIIVGFLGRMLNSIPVDRAQDHARKGTGKIYIKDDQESYLAISGQNTYFVKEFEEVSKKFKNQVAICVCYEKESYTAPIEKIVDSSELILKKSFDQKVSSKLVHSPLAFSYVPLIDQSDLYTSVFERLSRNQCIGIFPEGGSHDRAEMLPLKAGVSIMTLGYLSIYPDAEVNIIPCGLNYFNAHKFRSRAVIEFGDPIKVPLELVEKFKAGGEQKRSAIEEHLRILADALKSVTVNVPDFETLQVIQAARRLYRPDETQKKPDVQLELNRRFLKGYLQYKNDTKIIQLRQSILDYNNLLSAFGIRDHQVRNTQIELVNLIIQLIYHLSILLVFGLIAAPGFIINAPALYIISRISKKKAVAAKKASSVKIHGKDVISTWKLLVAVVVLPLIYTIYSAIIILHTPTLVRTNVLIIILEYFVMFYLLGFVSYATVRLSELVINSYNSLKPLMLTISNPKRYHILRQVRSTLREQINLVVEELGPTVVDDFEQNRIIKSPKESRSGRTTPFLSQESINFYDPLYSSPNNSGEFGSGRASPVFDSNMESIEIMLSQCKNTLTKRKLE